MEYCKEIVANLERKILPINSRFNCVFEEIEMGIFNSKATLKKLRIRISTEGFLSPAEECLFFKTIKPKPLGYLIFYLTLTSFETGRPQNSVKRIKKYIQAHLSNYQSYYFEHKNFYQYLERNRTDRDSEYFLRSAGIIKFHPDVLQYCVDDGFSTSHDFIVAKFFAHKLLIERLHNELKAIENPKANSGVKISTQLQWTGNQIDLIELGYALHSVGAINNGNIDIKVLIHTLAQIVNIEVKEIYRVFHQIHSRKINQTKFLDLMRNSLKSKMDQADL
jgi:hypothetical protein